MSAATDFLSPHTEERSLRPFDIRRDLRPVADLVEVCFSDTLDPDGRSYLQHMRAAANNTTLMRWASAAAEWTSVPLGGYVWEEQGRIVGNVSLIPYQMRGRRNFLIANVAVDPVYRRRGIARSLTLQAVEHVRRKGVPSVWLHVRSENEGAIHLYASLGFAERARRTTWYSQPQTPRVALSGESLSQPLLPPELRITPRLPQHWPSQQAWLQARYPAELTWHLPINLRQLQPGLLGALSRLITPTRIWQRSLLRGETLIGAVAWQTSRSFSDNLWLAAPEREEEQAAYALLAYARRRLSSYRSLSLDYPSGRAAAAIQAAGFYEHQTLIWMEKVF